MAAFPSLLAFLLILPSAGITPQQSLSEALRIPRDSPEGVHGWMALMETAALQAEQTGKCNAGPLYLLMRMRIPHFELADRPEIRDALELYRDSEEPYSRLLARAHLSTTYDDAVDLLFHPQRFCIDQLWWHARDRTLTLVGSHGRPVDPERDRPLFEAAKAQRLRPLKIWGHFVQAETAGSHVVYPVLLVELDGVWMHWEAAAKQLGAAD